MPFVSRKSLVSLLVLAVVALLLLGGFLWSGLYDVGADDPHTRPVLVALDILRDRSIHARSKDITVPRLDEPQLILKGAGQYAAMCTGCHLAPGMEESEIRPGLYPQPPELSKMRLEPREAFWTIKHGIKMTGMPAWGSSHDDPTIWSMVAFLQKLPDLTPAQYRDLVAKAPPDEEMEGGHHHHHGDEHQDDASHANEAGAAPGHTHENAEHEATAIAGYLPKAVPGAEAVAMAFHAALEAGNRRQVLELLAPEAKISEGGETQDRTTYAAAHLDEDIASLRQAIVHTEFMGSMPMGDTAMVATRSEIHPAGHQTARAARRIEILTLENTGRGWLITRIEWSSEAAP
jgi:mono/diheme cytochrome c family protein